MDFSHFETKLFINCILYMQYTHIHRITVFFSLLLESTTQASYQIEQACFITPAACVIVFICAQPGEKCFRSGAELSAVEKHYEGVRKTDDYQCSTQILHNSLTIISRSVLLSLSSASVPKHSVLSLLFYQRCCYRFTIILRGETAGKYFQKHE